MKAISPISPTPPLINSSISFHLITLNINIAANAATAPKGSEPYNICITNARAAASKVNQCLGSISVASTSSIPFKGKSLYSLSFL